MNYCVPCLCSSLETTLKKLNENNNTIIKGKQKKSYFKRNIKYTKSTIKYETAKLTIKYVSD